MKLSALRFLVIVVVFANCEGNKNSEFLLDKDESLTTKDIFQNRNMSQYEQGGHFWCRTRTLGKFGNEKDLSEGEKKVRDFIWQHWNERKYGYIKLSCPGTDTQNTAHYFIEPDKKGEWNVVRSFIFRASNDETTQHKVALNMVERIEENGDWSLVLKSSNEEFFEELPKH